MRDILPDLSIRHELCSVAGRYPPKTRQPNPVIGIVYHWPKHWGNGVVLYKSKHRFSSTSGVMKGAKIYLRPNRSSLCCIPSCHRKLHITHPFLSAQAAQTLHHEQYFKMAEQKVMQADQAPVSGEPCSTEEKLINQPAPDVSLISQLGAQF